MSVIIGVCHKYEASLSAMKQVLRLFPRTHLKVLVLLCLALFGSLFMMPSASPRITTSLTINTEQLDNQSSESEQQLGKQNWRWQEYTVKSGDSLSVIFDNLDIPAKTLHALMQSSTLSRELTRIHPKEKLQVAFEGEKLAAITYSPSALEKLIFLRDGEDSFKAEREIRQAETQVKLAQATIQGSLSVAGADAGLSQNMIMEFANIFSGVIDFIFDPRKGDTFSVLYEEEYIDGKKIGNGNILMATYKGSRETFTAYRFKLSDNSTGYFNEEGLSMRKPFLRAPVDFTRISSGFNLRRIHPIHKRIKAHRGIDYVAKTGTPIFAVGDGYVQRSGFTKANGNYIFIKHGTNYVTKYLHLHRRYVKTGQKIKQREVIGTVGSTGYSTAPHLHYEFLVNGVHRNPRTIFSKLPSAKPIPKAEKPRFEQQLKYLDNLYAYTKDLTPDTRLVNNDNE